MGRDHLGNLGEQIGRHMTMWLETEKLRKGQFGITSTDEAI
jgi:hypothetical protein